jgi:phosphoglycolate phosphatase
MTLLNGSNVEIVSGATAPRARTALFDFDGTVSLIRSGWEQVMLPMMVEVLLQLKTGETAQQLHDIAAEFVARLTGKQTIYQMIELASQVQRRGGQPLEPLEYKRMYHDRLWALIGGRVEGLRAGRIDPETMMVPGTRDLLERLRGRGLRLYLASGTDEVYMADEARLLGVDRYFEGGVRGAQDDYKRFSKKMVIEGIIAEMRLSPGELLSFGDGYVEIENTKEAGGVAIGVATDEPECRQVNPWKRQRLMAAGADVIIPNFLEAGVLMDYLFDRHEPIEIRGIRPQPPETSSAG